jgi:hypothetical protein
MDADAQDPLTEPPPPVRRWVRQSAESPTPMGEARRRPLPSPLAEASGAAGPSCQLGRTRPTGSGRLKARDFRSQKLDINKRQPKRRPAVSSAELFSALEAVLPFGQIEIDCQADYVRDFPDDPDHAEDAERVRQGQAAIETARRLIARKTYYVRKQEQALRESRGPAPSSPEATDER